MSDEKRKALELLWAAADAAIRAGIKRGDVEYLVRRMFERSGR
jgi:hypothetical protein